MKYCLLIVLYFISLCNSSKANKDKAALEKFDQALSCWTSNTPRALAITDSLLGLKQQCQIPNWEIWNLQAKIYLRLRNTIKSIECAQKADSSYKSHFHSPSSVANSILAISYKDKGDLPQAIIHYQIAADYAQDTLNRINNLSNMAEIELAAGDTTSAFDHLESNIQYVKSVQNLNFKGYFYLQYARLMSQLQQNVRRTLPYYLQAAQMLEECKEYHSAGFASVGAARAYENLNRRDSCRWWLNKALELQIKGGRPLGLADVYMNLASYECNNMNYKAALNLYQTAWPYAEKANYLPIMENILKQLAVVFEKNGDYQTSVLFLKKHNELKDSIGKQKWLAQLSELQIRYSVKQKDKQLKQLQEKAVHMDGIQWSIIGVGILVLGGGFALALFVNSKKKNRIEKDNLQGNGFKLKTNAKDRTELWTQLLHILENDKLYRDPDLNLNSLAKYLKTNRSTLSEVINNHGNRSFSNLINHYRLEEACKLLAHPSGSHLSVEGIGQETGFKSRSAFYSAFTAEIGETPSVFRKRQQIAS